MNDQKIKRVGIMIDSESLGLEPKSVMTQFAFIAFDMDDPESIIKEDEYYLPIQPQIKPLGRTVNGDTIIWWMDQPDAARKMFRQNRGNDYDELVALVQSAARKIGQVIADVTELGGTYEVISRGTDHDFPMIQSLFDDLGLEAPWKYDAKMDLRTVMKEAGIKKGDVEVRAGLVPHHALSDCRYQIDCLIEAWRRKGATV
jgi:hypothetical protein